MIVSEPKAPEEMTLAEDISRTLPNLSDADRHRVAGCIEMATDNALRQLNVFFGQGTSIDFSKDKYHLQGCLELLIGELQRRV